ncbi:MAG TPA: hypothetical protein VGP26_09030 [Actinophytocola sp.]|jgi:uncharacterized small protein (DUF1192 family)|nr:hypothetical protein [Actinophytocola sp.]
MLAAPAPEFPEFPAALASLMLLSPAEVPAQLTERAAALSAEIGRARAELAWSKEWINAVAEELEGLGSG